MRDETTNLGTTANPGGGGFTPSSPTFTILPRGRRTLKERLISSISSSDAIRAEAMERLGVTQADIKEMTEEEVAAFYAKANKIAGDILSGLTLKQVLKLRVNGIYSPKDGDTLRQPIKVLYENPESGGGASGAGGTK